MPPPSRRPGCIAAVALTAFVVAACTPAPQPDATPSSQVTVAPSATPPASPSTSAPPTPMSTAVETPPDVEDLVLGLQPVVEGLQNPVWADSPGDGRIWIAEQPGRIVVVEDGELRAEAVVDLEAEVLSGGERGLLAFAFHDDDGDGVPDRLVVHHSAEPDGRTRVVAMPIDVAAARADASAAEVLLEVPQPAGNHNGGTVAFGPDGNLWLGLGDGGGARDQFGQAQRADTPLGAILRVHLEPPGGGYTIPADNPYADGGGAPEVWATGLRNPWRLTFDGTRLFVADVGQSQREEVSVLDSTDHSGLNLGWPLREGTRCFSGDCGESRDLVDPVVEFGHDEGCSIIGGLVYRGTALPALDGHYFYSDLCGGFLRSFRLDGAGHVVDATDWTDDVGTLGSPLSFGRDDRGELLVLTADGRVQRLVAA